MKKKSSLSNPELIARRERLMRKASVLHTLFTAAVELGDVEAASVYLRRRPELLPPEDRDGEAEAD